ncbi:MAG: hypothetical protein ACYC9Y_12940 [Candidatus Methylomirabilia bacterium]
MGIIAGKPAGVQIKRWLVVLVVSMVALDLIATASLLTLQSAITRIHERYQPELISAGEISTLVHQAQSSLYKYLGEYLPDTGEVAAHTATLEKTIAAALTQDAGAEWRANLEAIKSSLAKYRVVINNLPRIGGVTNWSEVNELRSQAKDLGQAMERTAVKLKADAVAKIGAQAQASLRLSLIAVYLFLGFFALSIVITILLYYWWKNFQDMILNL